MQAPMPFRATPREPERPCPRRRPRRGSRFPSRRPVSRQAQPFTSSLTTVRPTGTAAFRESPFCIRKFPLLEKSRGPSSFPPMSLPERIGCVSTQRQPIRTAGLNRSPAGETPTSPWSPPREKAEAAGSRAATPVTAKETGKAPTRATAKAATKETARAATTAGASSSPEAPLNSRASRVHSRALRLTPKEDPCRRERLPRQLRP